MLRAEKGENPVVPLRELRILHCRLVVEGSGKARLADKSRDKPACDGKADFECSCQNRHLLPGTSRPDFCLDFRLLLPDAFTAHDRPRMGAFLKNISFGT